MHTEPVKARVFDVTPVRENSQLHKPKHLVTGVLRESRGEEDSGTDGGEER